MIETGSAYLRIVGPAYGFFGLGLSLYFASQGAGRLFWPLFCGFFRVVIAVVGGWIALRLTGSLTWLFAALALGLVVFGTGLAAAIRSGAWFRGSTTQRAIAMDSQNVIALLGRKTGPSYGASAVLSCQPCQPKACVETFC